MSRTRTAALVGNPNAGKSALFNALTGARQKIANYPGVTVERKAGRLMLPTGEAIELTDLPGSYSLHPTSPDEEVTRQVILGELPGEAAPDVLVLVLDASNLEQHLVFAQEIIALGRPTVVALNMIDLATRDGLVLDPAALASGLGVPVIPTVAVRRRGLNELARAIAEAEAREETHPQPHTGLSERRLTAHAITDAAILSETAKHRLHARMDQLLLHPWLGPLILFALLFVVFQAVFTGATPFADALDAGATALGNGVRAVMPPSLLRDLITDGVISGVGSVVVFLPQILILFFFILAMEASGYMARAAFLMDRLMAYVGLSGQFHPAALEFRLRDSRDHGDAEHFRSQRPTDDDPDRPADDLLGALASLYNGDRGLYPEYACRAAGRASGAGRFRPADRGYRQRDGGGAGAAPLCHQGRCQRFHHGTAQIPVAASQ